MYDTALLPHGRSSDQYTKWPTTMRRPTRCDRYSTVSPSVPADQERLPTQIGCSTTRASSAERSSERTGVGQDASRGETAQPTSSSSNTDRESTVVSKSGT